MIFEFNTHQGNIKEFLSEKLPLILNEYVMKLWSTHTNILSNDILLKYLEDRPVDNENVLYALDYLKNKVLRETDAMFISKIYNTEMFRPFTLTIKCSYNKKFLDIETNNDIYNKLIRNLINIIYDGEVVESGKHIMDISDTVHKEIPINAHDVFLAVMNIGIKINPEDCIKNYDANLIELAEQKIKIKHA